MACRRDEKQRWCESERERERERTRARSNESEIEGRCRLVYSPDKPLSCGAKVWIEVMDEHNIVAKKAVAFKDL